MKGTGQVDLGLLILRIGAGVMMMTHGWGKVMMLVNGQGGDFPDIIGIGSTPALALAAFAEFACALAIVLGVLTRLAAIPLIITMGVAAFIAHSADPFNVKEMALLYLTVFLTLAFTGAGKWSVDGRFGKRSGRR